MRTDPSPDEATSWVLAIADGFVGAVASNQSLGALGEAVERDTASRRSLAFLRPAG